MRERFEGRIDKNNIVGIGGQLDGEKLSQLSGAGDDDVHKILRSVKIVFVLKQVEMGTLVDAVCRTVGV